jgi:hypothetical protein
VKLSDAVQSRLHELGWPPLMRRLMPVGISPVGISSVGISPVGISPVGISPVVAGQLDTVDAQTDANWTDANSSSDSWTSTVGRFQARFLYIG